MVNAPSLALALFCVSAPALAQAPGVVNGTLDQRRVAGPLDGEIAVLAREAAPTWVGYLVKARGESRNDGCWERGRGVVAPVRLESSDDLVILVRLENHAVDRVRISALQCPLDLGGLTLHWLTGVTADASLDWLASFTTGASPRRLEGSAILATALHGDPRALDRLIALARDGRSSSARSTALFWLAQRAGDRAAGTIAEALEQDPDTRVKRQAVFALSQLPRDQGVPKLIDVAKTNRNPAVRKQAIFWLGQSQDPRALAFFEEVLGAK